MNISADTRTSVLIQQPTNHPTGCIKLALSFRPLRRTFQNWQIHQKPLSIDQAMIKVWRMMSEIGHQAVVPYMIVSIGNTWHSVFTQGKMMHRTRLSWNLRSAVMMHLMMRSYLLLCHHLSADNFLSNISSKRLATGWHFLPSSKIGWTFPGPSQMVHWHQARVSDRQHMMLMVCRWMENGMCTLYWQTDLRLVLKPATNSKQNNFITVLGQAPNSPPDLKCCCWICLTLCIFRCKR